MTLHDPPPSFSQRKTAPPLASPIGFLDAPSPYDHIITRDGSNGDELNDENDDAADPDSRMGTDKTARRATRDRPTTHDLVKRDLPDESLSVPDDIPRVSFFQLVCRQMARVTNVSSSCFLVKTASPALDTRHLP